MKFVVLIDKTDSASSNIGKFLREQHPTIPLHFLEKESIYNENIDKKPELKQYDFFIFATKHQGKKEKMLSVHAPGNWNKAEYGGKEGGVCKTSALFLKQLFINLNNLNKKAKSSYETILEVTHHGPYIEKPCCFIEIGSSPKQWNDELAIGIIATTISKIIKTYKPKKYKTTIGIGGPHYCPNFSKIQLNSNIAISHIIPQYAFPITEQTIKEAINKTQEKSKLALIDWKGLKSEQRQQAIKILDKLKLEYKKTSEIEK